MTKDELYNLDLETQLDKFIESFQQLNIENTALRKKISHLSLEYSSLLEKQKKIAESIKKTISQLQDELYVKSKGNISNKS